MLTIEQFTYFDNKSRYDITMDMGMYLSTCRYRKAEINFYSLYDFVVEVWKSPASDRIFKVEATIGKNYSALHHKTATCLN